jgi:hypothetical protein
MGLQKRLELSSSRRTDVDKENIVTASMQTKLARHANSPAFTGRILFDRNHEVYSLHFDTWPSSSITMIEALKPLMVFCNNEIPTLHVNLQASELILTRLGMLCCI